MEIETRLFDMLRGGLSCVRLAQVRFGSETNDCGGGLMIAVAVKRFDETYNIGRKTIIIMV